MGALSFILIVLNARRINDSVSACVDFDSGSEEINFHSLCVNLRLGALGCVWGCVWKCVWVRFGRLVAFGRARVLDLGQRRISSVLIGPSRRQELECTLCLNTILLYVSEKLLQAREFSSISFLFLTYFISWYIRIIINHHLLTDLRKAEALVVLVEDPVSSGRGGLEVLARRALGADLGGPRSWFHGSVCWVFKVGCFIKDSYRITAVLEVREFPIWKCQRHYI